ncbi:MAG TPA: DUF3014 domain-containing protein [Luteitalea sp.]|nr:DUF3014 domain-containing protein [Luteitalea sp.]
MTQEPPYDPDRLRGADAGLDDPPIDPLYQEQPRTGTPWVWITVLIVLVGAGVWWFAPRSSQSPAEAVGRTPTEPAIEQPSSPSSRLGTGEPDADLPPLDQMDSYVRPLLAALSARPELAALLASDDLVRRFVVSVDTIARGESPARQVKAVAPSGGFAVQSTREGLIADGRTYARYDGLVSLVGELDPAAMAAIYGRLQPRLDQAYGELGTGGSFDDAMRRALVHLLRTPDLTGPPALRTAGGTNYAYVDARLEGQSAAQRQLMRLGPERLARVKARLRAFGQALGIPASELS